MALFKAAHCPQRLIFQRLTCLTPRRAWVIIHPWHERHHSDTKAADRKAGRKTAQGKARRARKREQPLGIAIVLGLAATLAAGILIAVVSVLLPGTAAHQFFSLVSHIQSATLPLDPLYQEWADKLSEEEVFFATPLSLLFGGLTLGWLAPSYVDRRRVLLSGALLGFGVVAASVAFVWVFGTLDQKALNHIEGGQQVNITAPPELIVKQVISAILWTAICVGGTWLGLRGRERARQAQK